MVLTLFANAIAADAGLIPGFVPLGPVFGMPLSVLAAFLERPLYTRGGITHCAIWFSLQANLVSLLCGYVFAFLAVPIAMSGNPLALLCPFAAIAISVFTERAYLRRCGGWAELDLDCVIGANLFSAAVCIGILVVAHIIRGAYPYQVVKYASEYQTWLPRLESALAVGSIGLFVAAFCLARRPVPATDDIPLPQDG